MGISREHQDKLFSEFFTTKSAGVGLGLTIAYQAVENHGGSIEVESQVGQGSIFRIYLPVSRQNR
jgi:signal transduction histidine kinase